MRGRHKQSNDPRQQPTQPQYANYWAPLTRKRHIPPHPAQPQHTNDRAPRTRKRHQQEHRPQRPTESSDPTQHAKGRTGDCPGPRKGATTRRSVTQGAPARGLTGATAAPSLTHPTPAPLLCPAPPAVVVPWGPCEGTLPPPPRPVCVRSTRGHLGVRPRRCVGTLSFCFVLR